MSSPGASPPAPESSHTDRPGGTGRLVVEDATCTGCGCLCDDIWLAVEGDRIVEAGNACPVGRRWFLEDHGPGESPAATIEGVAVEAGEAIARGAAILAGARAPVILGLSRTTTETAGVATAIADRIGAVLSPGVPAESGPRTLAMQRVGRVSATLGEVKNRADVVVFWGVDPVVTHPRHFERYSVEPPGRFIPEGRAGRTVIVADSGRTATADRADYFLRLLPGLEYATLWALRAFVRGISLDPGAVEKATGHPAEALRELANLWKRARYGAWFTGPRPGRSAAEHEAELMLVRDLNASTRFVILSLGGPGNAPGAEAVVAWQSGVASSVDFASGAPRYAPGASSAVAMLERGEADAALIVADLVEEWLPEAARANLAKIPRIAIAPRATSGDAVAATVALACATYGIDAPGTVTRVDGVVLPLRPPLAASRPTDAEILRAILARLSTRMEDGS